MDFNSSKPLPGASLATTFNRENRELEETVERLSGGLRVRSAVDDPAGIQLAARLRLEAISHTRGVKNASDGADLAEYGEAAVNELTSVMTQLGDLALMASNSTVAGAQRTAIVNEASQLQEEYQRILATAMYNERTLLSTSGGTRITVQVGDTTNNSITLNDGVGVDDVTFDTSYDTTTYDGTFNAATSINAGLTLSSPAFGDFNQDGNLDLVTGDNNNIFVQFGSGDGTFGAMFTFSMASNAGSTLSGLSVGDVNGDAIDDIVVMHNGTPGYIGTLIGNGDGTFQTRQTTAETQSNVVRLFDVDGDGFDDIFYRNGAVDQLAYRPGVGDGTFGVESILVSGDVRSVSTGDFNNDGNLDVLSGLSTNQMQLVLGNGDGTFDSPITLATGYHVMSLAVADYNEDGNLDVIATNNGLPNVMYYQGNGDGTFAAEVSFAAPGSTRVVVTTDVNNDGMSDLVGFTDATGVAAVWLGKGNGTFASYTSQALGTAGSAGGVALGDINSDGADDVLVTYGGSTGIRRLIAQSTTTSTAGQFDLTRIDGAEAAVTQFTENLDALTNELKVYESFNKRLTASADLNTDLAIIKDDRATNILASDMDESLATKTLQTVTIGRAVELFKKSSEIQIGFVDLLDTLNDEE